MLKSQGANLIPETEFHKKDDKVIIIIIIIIITIIYVILLIGKEGGSLWS